VNSDVAVVDGNSHSVTLVPTGTSPYAIDINLATNKIYVANYGTNSVTVIDGATNATKTISVGTNPDAVAVNPETNKIYVANANSNNVPVINGSNNSVSRVAVGTYPTALAVNPVTNTIHALEELKIASHIVAFRIGRDVPRTRSYRGWIEFVGSAFSISGLATRSQALHARNQFPSTPRIIERSLSPYHSSDSPGKYT
jgi:YVTN family beta-propeller protein